MNRYLKDAIIFVLLFAAGALAGILLRTQYFGDSLVWIWNT